MSTILQATAILGVIFLPGALFAWAFERLAGQFGIQRKDRALRFVGGSAVFFALFSAPLYWLYANYWHAFAGGQPLPGWLAVVPLAYVALPAAAGTLLGRGVRVGWRWTRVLFGVSRAPRAWDYLFEHRRKGWVRCRLKSGTWIGGAVAEVGNRQSFAARYPEPQDLYLAATIDVDPRTGESHGDWQTAAHGNIGVLLRWEDIEYLEFIHADERQETDVEGDQEGT
ncbi:MAG: DUF6338 family protein [bacterium]|nr:DUF6338 family protein [bacterium]MCY3952245.1 DUF6338 family protein [bacterium]MCY4102485.1 DUF6338 family protein [bacterium]